MKRLKGQTRGRKEGALDLRRTGRALLHRQCNSFFPGTRVITRIMLASSLDGHGATHRSPTCRTDRTWNACPIVVQLSATTGAISIKVTSPCSHQVGSFFWNKGYHSHHGKSHQKRKNTFHMKSLAVYPSALSEDLI